MQLKCAIFDFDGTLFDSMPIWQELGANYLRSLSIEPADNLNEVLASLSLEQAACYLKATYKLPQTPNTIIASINQLIANYYRYEILPKIGVVQFVQALNVKGVTCCIATASNRDLVQAALGRCDLLEQFQAIFTCSELGCGKDQPYVYETAIKELKVKKVESLIFEDALHAIQTAKKSGFYVAGVYDASESRQKELKSLADLYLLDFKQIDKFWQLAMVL